MKENENIERDKHGRFVPGCSSSGRPKGSRNRAGSEVKDRFQQLVDSYSLEQMKIDLMELEPGERLRVMTGLLDFFIPKLNRTDHALQGGNDFIVVQLPAPLSLPKGEKLRNEEIGESEDEI